MMTKKKNAPSPKSGKSFERLKPVVEFSIVSSGSLTADNGVARFGRDVAETAVVGDAVGGEVAVTIILATANVG
jgi:hypothetical protein